ncbi:hypothetical protein A3C25_06385 [Candidatus Roizmanbacteria bacterium RIFCSPHIGHO2_02_FULL_38_11]|uniref:Uncharacterized protein n=1 Tax=Candidatus Roizmanbacteria bacterium RIFCSPHIGHO2_02_FULL_38_11 TaxID=1802039 RepID=A0A1F7GW76_9BACT|nr:MAG: hypothetical protein A3C25_06385 [Candidatus Roizmanbacteria bacterium RIFCSPHIGHO2_02_FULL_38_11]
MALEDSNLRYNKFYLGVSSYIPRTAINWWPRKLINGDEAEIIIQLEDINLLPIAQLVCGACELKRFCRVREYVEGILNVSPWLTTTLDETRRDLITKSTGLKNPDGPTWRIKYDPELRRFIQYQVPVEDDNAVLAVSLCQPRLANQINLV